MKEALAHSLQAYSLPEAFWLMCLKTLAWVVSVARDWRLLRQIYRECGALQRKGSGIIFLVIVCGASFSSFGDAGAIFGNNFTPVRACCFQEVDTAVLEGEGVASPACWPPQWWGPLADRQAYLPGPSQAPGTPLTPDQLHIVLILMHPSVST